VPKHYAAIVRSTRPAPGLLHALDIHARTKFELGRGQAHHSARTLRSGLGRFGVAWISSRGYLQGMSNTEAKSTTYTVTFVNAAGHELTSKEVFTSLDDAKGYIGRAYIADDGTFRDLGVFRINTHTA
jgi:hypothetical protein